MQLLPKRENLYWTEHVRQKMRQYRLSESRIKRILRHPKRLEIGVAPDTVAGMQPAGSKKHPYEIWVMWSLDKARDKQQVKKARFNLDKKIIIISAWRYPGVSPVHEPPPIPDDVWKDLLKSKIAKKRK
jgi:hypothetical protein